MKKKYVITTGGPEAKTLPNTVQKWLQQKVDENTFAVDKKGRLIKHPISSPKS